MNLYRSHNCGELNINHINENVYISGWINKIRDHGGVLFVDLRDQYGLTQCEDLYLNFFLIISINFDI